MTFRLTDQLTISRDGVSLHGRIIPANIKAEKNDALCPESPTRVHFLLQRFDSTGLLLPVAMTCESCGKPVKQDGARWVLDEYIIHEADELSDLL